MQRDFLGDQRESAGLSPGAGRLDRSANATSHNGVRVYVRVDPTVGHHVNTGNLQG